MSSGPFDHWRVPYGDAALAEATLPPEPLPLFAAWLAAAAAAGVQEPNAMALATIAEDGAPACRVVLLKGVDAHGFRFFTNLDSAKGRHLARDPRAALTFWWTKPVARQVRVTGTVARLPDAEADAYFGSRPRDSQIAAAVSPQSRVIAGRAFLEDKGALLAELGDRAIPRPSHWGGYLVRAATIEFWQGRDHRLHDRVRYTEADGGWARAWLAP